MFLDRPANAVLLINSSEVAGSLSTGTSTATALAAMRQALSFGNADDTHAYIHNIK